MVFMRLFPIKLGLSKIQKRVIFILSNFLIFLLITPLPAGPFLKIDSVDSETEFPKIKVHLTVKNVDNTIVTGLNEENILLYEDGYRVNYVRIRNLAETDGFFYIVYSIDSSKSITNELLRLIKKSATELLNKTNSNDMIAIYRFNDKVELMNNFTNNRADLVKNIKKIERHGTKTMLFDAIYSSINLLHMSDVTRKAVIVFTDGKDEGSSVNFDDIVNLARETSIPVYCLSLKSSNNIKLLTRLCKLTGGMQINIDENDIGSVYKSIINMINRQYIVDYQSIIEPDGHPHKLEVRLKYDAIRDRDQKDIVVKKRLDFIHFPSTSEILLIGLIFILIGLLIFFLIYTLRRLNNVISVSPVEADAVSSYSEASQSIEPHGGVRPQGDDIPYPGDEELLYSKTWLVERDGKEAGKKIPVHSDEIIIGRDKTSAIVVEGKSVSPKHAKIKKIKNSYYLFDIASDSGTFLNENKLLRPKLLYDWDEIRIGKKIFIFRGSNIA